MSDTPETDETSGSFVRFVYPGHLYHNQIGEIIAGDIDCCLLRFHAIGRDFGPCFRDQQGKLEPVPTPTPSAAGANPNSVSHCDPTTHG